MRKWSSHYFVQLCEFLWFAYKPFLCTLLICASQLVWNNLCRIVHLAVESAWLQSRSPHDTPYILALLAKDLRLVQHTIGYLGVPVDNLTADMDVHGHDDALLARVRASAACPRAIMLELMCLLLGVAAGVHSPMSITLPTCRDHMLAMSSMRLLLTASHAH